MGGYSTIKLTFIIITDKLIVIGMQKDKRMLIKTLPPLFP
jgi:hypothetical protein